MKGTFRIANISGIPLRIHWTFLLILIWVVFAGMDSSGTIEISHLSNLFISVFTLFACVILHELGHALAARRYGIKTRNIVLLPFGGIAMLERLPVEPKHELIVALAGPMVNFLIALVFLPFLLMIDGNALDAMINFLLNFSRGAFPPYSVTFLNWFLFFMVSLNIVVGIFNLIPAMPMDGGRVLRALLATQFPKYKATQLAAITGAVLSGLLAIYGVIELNWILVFIGLYVFTSAFGEFRTVKNEMFLAKNKVHQLMDNSFGYIHANSNLEEAINAFQNGEHNYLLVKDEEEKILGILTEKSILEAVKHMPTQEGEIGRYFPNLALQTEENQSLQDALNTMYKNQRNALTVMDGNQLKGIIDKDTIHHFLK